MPKTYSVDLREKAIQFYKESEHKSKTCEIFNIARTTLDDWILLEQQTGQLKQPKSPNVGRPSKILDLQAFEASVKTTPFTQAKDLNLNGVCLNGKRNMVKITYFISMSQASIPMKPQNMVGLLRDNAVMHSGQVRWAWHQTHYDQCC